MYIFNSDRKHNVLDIECLSNYFFNLHLHPLKYLSRINNIN